MKQDKIDRGAGAPGELTTAEKQELARLRRENAELRMEREILKQAAAFFAFMPQYLSSGGVAHFFAAQSLAVASP